ncbi:site-2 protease family protein [Streptomyces sp. S.PB5]|uniref:site-2 protease family protein n=1 Tax=Streptomyces sp. S.PB5 TaxID=3020844 RepID=UPI0025B10189|nr:site-2 protease family protein [Streptomyces sp. S.PB5]MDN3028987.1 site-2 protease family protein [Streptomyces sp. S.PB5]
MKETLPLGRIAGIRVGLHWSVLVILGPIVLIALLVSGHSPQTPPDHPSWAYWVLGLVAAVTYVASLLAHELAHAVVARRNGVKVDGITLWMLGGVARLHSEARTPGAELRIAAVGPLTSALVGGLCTGLALWLDSLHATELMVEAVAWLAAINIMLTVFNALPAAPLDGERLLRAVLWHRTGDRLRATRGAAAAGRVLGWFLIVTGVAVMIVAGELSGLWPALIGWFLINTATAEERRAELRGVLDEIPVSRVMTRAPVTVPATMTIASFLAEGPFGHYHHSAFPVLAPDSTAAGLVTVRHVNRSPFQARSTTTIGDVMRPLPDVTTAGPDDLVVDLLPRLEASPDRRALVLDDGHLMGIVTLADITRTLTWLTTTRPKP